MLPSFPNVKRELDEFLTLFLQQRVRFHEGVVGEISEHMIQEGDENSIIRPNGDEDKTEFVTGEHVMELEWRELPGLALTDVLSKVDRAAEDMASQKSRHFFETVGQGADKVGNVVDGHGQPLSPEILLEVLEKIQMDFDESGQAKELSVVISPSQKERVQEIMKQFEIDPELQKKHKEIMVKKKEQWRAREAARTLVG